MRRSLKKERLDRDLASLPGLTRADLCCLWRRHYGCEPIPGLPSSLLALAIAYRIQELVQGGLSPSLRSFLDDAAAGRRRPPPAAMPKPGTVLMREWHGTMHEVTVLEKGFSYRDQTHRSLTALARQITGIHRSGPAFFGLQSYAQ
jgi:hypothetical protein